MDVLDTKEDWLYVEALDQPFEERGYRGWIRSKLQEDGPPPPQCAVDRTLICTLAREWIDVPYLWGGLTGFGIDCSGLVHLLYRLAGITIPRNACHQYHASRPTDDPKPADLFFTPQLDHVMLYLGDNQFIEARGNPVKKVRIIHDQLQSNSPLWTIDALSDRM